MASTCGLANIDTDPDLNCGTAGSARQHDHKLKATMQLAVSRGLGKTVQSRSLDVEIRGDSFLEMMNNWHETFPSRYD